MTSRPHRLALPLLLASLPFLGTAAAMAQDLEPAEDEGAFGFYKPSQSAQPLTTPTVAASLFTGSASYSIPIDLPPGTGSFQPGLALTYDSRRKLGNAGNGWAAELPKIVRSTRYGITTTRATPSADNSGLDDAWPVFEYDGKELVRDFRTKPARNRDYFGVPCIRYYAEVTSYEKILFCPYSDAAPVSSDYWTVTQKDGTLLVFGRNGARLRFPGDPPGLTYEYYLDTVINSNQVSWRAEYSTYGQHPPQVCSVPGADYGAPRLERITYAYHRGVPVGTLRVIHLRWFNMCDGFQDIHSFADTRYGHLLTHPYMLRDIVVSIGRNQIRRYHLNYLASADNRAPLLSSLVVLGTNDHSSLPPTSFTYRTNVASPGSTSNGPTARPKVPWQLPNSYGLEYQQWGPTPWGVAGAFTRQTVVDLNGDGFLDLLVASQTPDPSRTSFEWEVHYGSAGGWFQRDGVPWPGVPNETSEAYDYLSTRFAIRRLDHDPQANGEYTRIHDLIDMNGDGLPDLVRGDPGTEQWCAQAPHSYGCSPRNTVYWNTGNGFTRQEPLRNFPWPGSRRSSNGALTNYEKPSSHDTRTVSDLIDMDGDGCPDRVFADGGATSGFPPLPAPHVWKVQLSTACAPGSAALGGAGFGRAGFAPPVNWKIGLADEDFDAAHGAPDYIGRTLAVDWSVAPLAGHRLYTVAELLDLNGDGLTDFFLYDPDTSTTRVFLGSGRGFVEESLAGMHYAAAIDTITCAFSYGHCASPYRFTRRVQTTTSVAPSGATSNDRGQVAGFTDKNGDHLLDFYVTNGWGDWTPYSFGTYLNNGRGLNDTPVHLMGGGNSSHSIDRHAREFITVALSADMDGSRTPDFLEPSGVTFNSLNGQPDLLLHVDNGIGGTTDLTYVTGPANMGPSTMNAGKNVFLPITSLSSMTTADGYGTEYHTHYSYDHAFFDRSRKLLTGFGGATVTRSDNIGTPTRTEFHIFASGDPDRTISDSWLLNEGFPSESTWLDHPALAGLEFGVTVGSLGPECSTQSWTPWRVAQVYQGFLRTVWFPESFLVRRYNIEHGQRRWIESHFEYGPFGNVAYTHNYGEVAILDGRIHYQQGNDEVYSSTLYALNELRNIVSQPAALMLCSAPHCLGADSHLLRYKRYYYDHRPLGHIDAQANLTSVEEWVGYAAELGYYARRRIAYDTYGNIRTAEDAEGGRLSLSYAAPDFALLASASTTVTRGKPQGRAVAIGSTYYWDERARLRDIVDPNGRWTHFAYDQLSRLVTTSSSKPTAHFYAPGLVSQTVPLVTRSYALGRLPGDSFVLETTFSDVDTVTTKRKTIFDGLSRAVQEQQPFDLGHLSVTGRHFNYLGKPAYEVLPHSVSEETGWPYQPFLFADFASPGQVPASDVWLTTYDYAGRETTRTLYAPIGSLTHSFYHREFGYPEPWTTTVSFMADEGTMLQSRYQTNAHGQLTRAQYLSEGNVEDVPGLLALRTVWAGTAYARDALPATATVGEGTITLTSPLGTLGARTTLHSGEVIGVQLQGGFDIGSIHFVITGGVLHLSCEGLAGELDWVGPGRASGHLSLSMKYQQKLTEFCVQTLAYQYDLVGNLTTYADAENNTTTMTYDTRGLMRSIADPSLSNCAGTPAACPVLYGYDKAGRLTTSTDAAGRRVKLFLDEIGRTYFRDYCDNQTPCQTDFNVSLQYDSATGGLGRLATSTQLGGAAVVDAFSYDSWGRPTTRVRRVAGLRRETTASYDYLGRTTSLVYPTQDLADASDPHVEYAYGPSGRVQSVRWVNDRPDLPTSQWVVQDISYDPLFRPRRVAWGTGLVTDFDYFDSPTDAPPGRQLLKSRQTHSLAPEVVLDGTAYTYRADGGLESTRDVVSGATTTFSYDGASDLSAASTIAADGTSLHSWNYRYGPSGRLLHATDTGRDVTRTATYSYDQRVAGPGAPTQVGDSTYTYDANGSVISVSTAPGTYAETFFYNADHLVRRSVRAPGEGETLYYYDAFGKRALRSRPASNEAVYYFFPHVEMEKTGGSFLRQYYIFLDGTRVGYITAQYPSTIWSLQSDAQGSIVMTTYGSGMSSRRTYSPYGERIDGGPPGLPERYGYAGMEQDFGGRLLNTGGRQYSPEVARFLQADPEIPDLLRLQGLDRYSYAFNNPLRYSDTSGRSPTGDGYVCVPAFACDGSQWQGGQSPEDGSAAAGVAVLLGFLSGLSSDGNQGGGGIGGATSHLSSSDREKQAGLERAKAVADPSLDAVQERLTEFGKYDIREGFSRNLMRSAKKTAQRYLRKEAGQPYLAQLLGGGRYRGNEWVKHAPGLSARARFYKFVGKNIGALDKGIRNIKGGWDLFGGNYAGAIRQFAGAIPVVEFFDDAWVLYTGEPPDYQIVTTHWGDLAYDLFE